MIRFRVHSPTTKGNITVKAASPEEARVAGQSRFGVIDVIVTPSKRNRGKGSLGRYAAKRKAVRRSNRNTASEARNAARRAALEAAQIARQHAENSLQGTTLDRAEMYRRLRGGT